MMMQLVSQNPTTHTHNIHTQRRASVKYYSRIKQAAYAILMWSCGGISLIETSVANRNQARG